eukprot:COSAG06_NODE_10566_length_1657_cov_11.355923_2_plen_255_part_00
MAIATGTALAISAGISAASAGASFVQAGKQKRLSEQAQRDADKAFKEAEAQLDVNYFEQLGISKTPYENQRDAIAQQAAQAMEIGRESERGGAATAGRVLAQSNIAQQGITDKQTKDLEALNKLVATEESRLGTARANLSLEQAEGAGFAAAQAQNQQNQAIMSGVSGLANAGMSLYENSELYKQDKVGGAAGLAGDTNTAVTLDAITPSSIPTNQAQLIRPDMSLSMTPAQQFQNTANNFNSANLLYNPFKVY